MGEELVRLRLEAAAAKRRACAMREDARRAISAAKAMSAANGSLWDRVMAQAMAAGDTRGREEKATTTPASGSDSLGCKSEQRRSEDGSPAPPVRETFSDLHAAYARTRNPGLRADLAAAYDSFAQALARGFPTRRESKEDLVQVARIGLLHAIDRFDPTRERPFLVFARTTILGELKRHVRDRSWSMHIPRSLQEHFLTVVRTVDDLAQELGRSPRISEVATRCGLSEEQVLESMELGRTHQPLSLDRPPGGDERRSLDPGESDALLDAIEIRMLVANLVGRLPQRERQVIHLRFVDELTQSQIAARLGVSQMQISRLLARALARLRAFQEAR